MQETIQETGPFKPENVTEGGPSIDLYPLYAI